LYKQIASVFIISLVYLCFSSNAILSNTNNPERNDKMQLMKKNHALEYYENDSDRIKRAKEIKYIENYLNLNPDWKNEAWPLRAELYNSVGDNSPANALKFYNKGVLCSRDKRYADAISYYKKSMELDPFFPWPANNMAWEYATCPESDLRNGHKAVKFANIAIKQINTPVADFLGTLAAAFAATGEFKKAEYFCREAQKIFPTTERKTMLLKFLANEIYIDYSDPPEKDENTFSKGYGKTKWGMTKLRIMSLYQEATFSDNDLMILPSVQIAGLKAKVNLHFFNDMLYKAVIHLDNIRISSVQKENLEKFLINEYGHPDFKTKDKGFIWNHNDTTIKYIFIQPSKSANITLADNKIAEIIAERDRYRIPQ